MPASYNTPHCTYPTPSWLLQALPCRRPKAPPSSLLAPACGMTGSDVCVEFVGWRVLIDHKHAGARIREPDLAITGIRGSARSAASVPCAQGVCICTAWPPSIKTTTGMRCCVGVARPPAAGGSSFARCSLARVDHLGTGCKHVPPLNPIPSATAQPARDDDGAPTGALSEAGGVGGVGGQLRAATGARPASLVWEGVCLPGGGATRCKCHLRALSSQQRAAGGADPGARRKGQPVLEEAGMASVVDVAK